MLIRSIQRVVPVVMPYFGLFITAYYIFAVVGMGIFAGDVTKVVELGGPGNWSTCAGEHCWKKTPYGEQHYYYDLNFDNTARSFYTLFMLMIQNNWHVATNGFTEVRGKGVRLFFILYWVLVTVIMINVFVGVLIEMLDLYRRDELAKADGSERSLMVFHDTVNQRLKQLRAPSGQTWSSVWEVYEKDSSAEQLINDCRLYLEASDLEGGDSDGAESQSSPGVNGSEISDSVVMQALAVPVYARSLDGEICYANDAFVTLFGGIMFTNQIMGRRDAELLGDDLSQRLMRSGKFYSWLDTREGGSGSEWRLHVQKLLREPGSPRSPTHKEEEGRPVLVSMFRCEAVEGDSPRSSLKNSPLSSPEHAETEDPSSVVRI